MSLINYLDAQNISAKSLLYEINLMPWYCVAPVRNIPLDGAVKLSLNFLPHMQSQNGQRCSKLTRYFIILFDIPLSV